MDSTIHVIAAIMGGVLLLVALASFFRSFWRTPPKRERDAWSPDGVPGGVQGPAAGSDGHADGGGGHAGD